MDVQIDEPGREKIARQIHHFFPAGGSERADLDDPAVLRPERKSVRDPVGKNQASVGEDHRRPASLRFPGRQSIILLMVSEYDVAIVGGAFSGAATALLMKRRRPETRILILEKATEFDRKVGESTTEVSSCFLTKILGLTSYLGHEQLPKQGLRLWFANRPDQPFDDCVEVGARYQARLPTFQVDRAKLDAHLLELARAAGCEVWKPAKVTRCELTRQR